eukprot:TRINITY_DN30591_c0_g1_i1.p1 TRINITY_DN30591_c0_g1~~TRINITY_DN30591_c0_g1_i1.p1  ORF type:complete len:189 (+),score=32.38 TRINITY_DN30591_c0_g1_i1:54-569(+)
MAAAAAAWRSGDPDGSAAEEALWALGVGSALPAWLRDQRAEERSRGLNCGPRLSAPPPRRVGLGPASDSNAAGGSRPSSSPPRRRDLDVKAVEDARRLGIEEWLAAVDSVGTLSRQYAAPLRRIARSTAEVFDLYVHNGLVDNKFFTDVGVSKLGHRRLFERWFRCHATHR